MVESAFLILGVAASRHHLSPQQLGNAYRKNQNLMETHNLQDPGAPTSRGIGHKCRAGLGWEAAS